MTKILGIDEAGRGPVIGPLVIAGVVVDESGQDKLKELKVKDSKKHLPEQREMLFEKIKAIAIDFQIEVISPENIDSALNDADNNLNWLEGSVIAKIISKLKPDIVYADCPSNNIIAFTNYVKERILPGNDKIKLVIEHKADEKYVSSSAASILAKVTRDREIEKLKKVYGDFGSGYPSDPKTQEFISKNHNLPIFRKTWSTWKNISDKKKQSRLADF